DPAGEDLVGEGRLDEALDRLAHRPRTQRSLPSAVRDEVIDEAGSGAEGDLPLLPQPARRIREEQRGDARDLVAAEWREDEPLVEPSPQLRRERGARLLESARNSRMCSGRRLRGGVCR